MIYYIAWLILRFYKHYMPTSYLGFNIDIIFYKLDIIRIIHV